MNPIQPAPTRRIGRRIAAACVGAIALGFAACAPQYDSPANATPDDASNEEACGAGKVVAFVGKADSPANRADIARLSNAASIRWLTPGMMVTMDYRSNRLNAQIDERGVYTRFHCS